MFGKRRPIDTVGLFVLCAVQACDNATAPLEPPRVPSSLLLSVEWQNPSPQGNDLNRIWGFPDGSFYAVGDAGTVLHFDGVSWESIETSVRADLHSIWASSPDDIYAAGFAGTLIHYNGTKWSRVSTPTSADLYAVAGSSSDDIFIAGSGGDVWNRSSGTWRSFAVAPGQRFRALLAYSHNEVYVCGSNASLYRFDGTSWAKVAIGVPIQGDSEFRDLWGPAPNQFAFLSGRGVAWTDGVSWRSLPEANNYFPYGLWGVSFDDLVMVAAGTSTHLQGGIEAFYPTPTPEPLYDVWGSTANNYYAVGRTGNIALFSGLGWEALSQGNTADLRDLSVSEVGATAVGSNGTILRQMGAVWNAENVAPGYDLSGVWETSGLGVAVGRYTADGRDWREAVLTRTGGIWTDPGQIGNAQRLFDVWGSSISDVFAVGWAGEIIRFNGFNWQIVDSGSGDAAFLKSVSGTNSNNVIAVGRTNDLHALICHFNGISWVKTELYGIEELYAVWSANEATAFAVGSGGIIRHLNGSVWSPMESPTQDALFCVWGTSLDDVYAAGWEGTLIHFDGDKWSSLRPATNRSFQAISGRSSSEIYLGGDRGTILLVRGLPTSAESAP